MGKVPLVLQRMAKKFTNIYNGCAQLLFCSINRLYGDVLVAVVVFLSSPIFHGTAPRSVSKRLL